MKNVWGFYSITRCAQPRTIEPILDCSLMQLYALDSWVNSSVWGLFPNCKTVGVRLKAQIPVSRRLDREAGLLWSAFLSTSRNSRTCRRRRYRGSTRSASKHKALISTRVRGLRGQLVFGDWLTSHLKSIYVNRAPARLAGLVHSKTLSSENAWSAINLRFWRASHQNFIRCVRWTSEFLPFSSVNVPVIAREEFTPLYPFFIMLPFLRLPAGQLLRTLARSYTFITVSDSVPNIFLEKSYAFFAPRRVVGEIKLCAAVKGKSGSAVNGDLGRAVSDLRKLELEYGDEFSDFINEKPAVLSLDGDVGFRLAPARTPLRVGLLKFFYRPFWLFRQRAFGRAISRSIRADWHLTTRAALVSTYSEFFAYNHPYSVERRARSFTHLHNHYNYNNLVRPWILTYWIIAEGCVRINRLSALGQLSRWTKAPLLTALRSLHFWQSFRSYLITIKVKSWLFFLNFHKISILFFYYSQFLSLWWAFLALHVRLLTGLAVGWTSFYNKWFGCGVYGYLLVLGFYYVLNGVLSSAIDIFLLWILVEVLGYCVLTYGVWTFSFLRMGTPLMLLWATLSAPTAVRLTLKVHKISYVVYFGALIFCKTVIYLLLNFFAFWSSKYFNFFLNTCRLIRLSKLLQKTVQYVGIGGFLVWSNNTLATAAFIVKSLRLVLKKTSGGAVNLNFLRGFNTLNAFWLFFYLVYLNFGFFGWWVNSMKSGAVSIYLNAVYFAKLFQETPSIGYYTVVSLVHSHSLKLLIYFFEVGAIRGFTSKSLSSSCGFVQQLLPNFLSNLEFARLYASDTFIEGYLHKAFVSKTHAISPIFGDGCKMGASDIGPGSGATTVTWWDYARRLFTVGGVLTFLLLAVIYRLVRFVWIYLIGLLLQTIFLITLITSTVIGILLQTYGWSWLLKVVLLYFFIICVRALCGVFIHPSAPRK